MCVSIGWKEFVFMVYKLVVRKAGALNALRVKLAPAVLHSQEASVGWDASRGPVPSNLGT